MAAALEVVLTVLEKEVDLASLLEGEWCVLAGSESEAKLELRLALLFP